jgi:hypothetical protein
MVLILGWSADIFLRSECHYYRPEKLVLKIGQKGMPLSERLRHAKFFTNTDWCCLNTACRRIRGLVQSPEELCRDPCASFLNHLARLLNPSGVHAYLVAFSRTQFITVRHGSSQLSH